MEMKMFAIYDSKTEVYTKPFFCLTMGEALRTFEDAINGERSPFRAHAADYTLFNIGIYDDATAIVEATAIVNMGCALEFVDDQPAYGPRRVDLPIEDQQNG